MKVYQATARALADNGVEVVFGLMGDANMFLVDSFVRECGGKFVSAAHEAGAATMALGYALASGKVGICTVTHGPATTNTITALVDGVKGSVPMVLLCGDTPAIDREHNQNVAQREFIIAAGAGFEQLRSPATVADDVARAIRRALTEHRPIALNLPTDFDWAETEYQPVRVQMPDNRAVVAASDDLDNAIGIIAAARRPVILAGRGACSAESREALLTLARRIEAPLATTLKAKDLFLGEDFNLGIFGTVSTAAAAETIIESDCIIAFGASLNRYTTSAGSFLKDKRVIQVNLEPAEIGKNVAPSVGVVGDPAAVAGIFVHWLDEAEIEPSGFRSDELRVRIAADDPEFGDDGEGTVDFQRALRKLDAMLPSDRLLVTDGGRFMIGAWTSIRAPGPRSFVSTVSFSSIGLGMGHAIGASYAADGVPTVLFTGDGGFMLGGLSEFNTAVRHKTDLIVVVCNDGAYGAEHIKFHNRQMDPGMILFDWPDFAPVAAALGGAGVTVRCEADWAEVEQAIANRTKPLLIDIKLDPDRI